jgi:hypothetical protein
MSVLPNRERLHELAEQIQGRMYDGDDCSDLLEEFQQNVPCRGPGIPEILDLLAPEVDGNYSVEDVVERALAYQWPKPRLTRLEMIELVEKIASADGSEAEQAEWLETLEANVPDPDVSNLVFWADPELSAEEIVDRALSYQVVALPPPGESHLLWAVRNGNTAVVKVILANGGDPNERSSDGRTPLQLARETGSQELQELLEQAGATG